MRTGLLTALVAAAATCVATPSLASVTISFVQSDSGVSVDIGGSIDTTNMVGSPFYLPGLRIVEPNSGSIVTNTGNVSLTKLPENTIKSFGNGGNTSSYSTSGVFGLQSFQNGNEYLILPYAYKPGDTISASLFFSGKTFDSLGITPVDFSYYLPSEDKISFTFSILNTAVPEPATWALTILGFGMIGAASRRKRKVRVHFA